MKKLIIVASALLIVILAVYLVNESANGKVNLTEYTYQDNALPKAFHGYKIMVISDLHNANFVGQIVQLADSSKPDIVVFTGDMVQLPGQSAERACAIADALTEKNIPVFAISGDHETENEFYDDIKEELIAHNVTFLEDEGVVLTRDDAKILLYGASDPGMNFVTTQQYDKLKKYMKKSFETEENRPLFKVLLNHRPDMYPELKHQGANLILSGDLHGGVVRLPFIGGLATKNCPYDYGFYQGEQGAASLIVSGGCDQNPKKKRVFNPPEVLLITLNGA